MKKVLSLLLVCTLALSLFTMTFASAEVLGNYNFKAYNFNTESYTEMVYNEDTFEEEEKTYWRAKYVLAEGTLNSGNIVPANTADRYTAEYFTIAVSADVSTASGWFALDYDTTKVVPASITVSKTSSTGAPTIRPLGATSAITASKCITMQSATGKNAVKAAVSMVGSYIDGGQIALQWMADSAADYSVNANEIVAHIGFACLPGITSDDFNADTIKVASDITNINGLISEDDKGLFGPLMVASSSTLTAKDETLGAVFAYPGSDKTVGGEEGGEDPGDDPVVTPTWNAGSSDVSDATAWTGAFEYKAEDGTTATAYTGKKVVIFGKNASGAELAVGAYGVKLGDRYYPGKEPVAAGGIFAIIILDTTGSRINVADGSYSIWTGTAEVNDVDQHTGTFVVETVAE